MPKSGLPVSSAGLSTPVVNLPIIRYSFGSFIRRVAWSGKGSFAASAASSPYPSERPVAPCSTRPACVEHSASGTPQRAAAAAIISCRPAAPARRSGSQLIGVAIDPPANCGPYALSSRLACSTCTWLHSTSSSSAISMGSMVRIPCPISGFLASITTLPSAVTRTKARGDSPAGCGAPCADTNLREVGVSYNPSAMPPPARAVNCRKCRRLTRI